MDEYEENHLLAGQEKLDEYWSTITKEMSQTIKRERQWANFFRIKYDALIEVGFTDEQAANFICAILGKST